MNLNTFSELQKYKKALVQLIKKDPTKFRVSCLELRAACLIGARSKDQVFNLKWDQLSKKNKNGTLIIGNKIKYIDTKNDDAMELFLKTVCHVYVFSLVICMSI